MRVLHILFITLLFTICSCDGNRNDRHSRVDFKIPITPISKLKNNILALARLRHNTAKTVAKKTVAKKKTIKQLASDIKTKLVDLKLDEKIDIVTTKRSGVKRKVPIKEKKVEYLKLLKDHKPDNFKLKKVEHIIIEQRQVELIDDLDPRLDTGINVERISSKKIKHTSWATNIKISLPQESIKIERPVLAKKSVAREKRIVVAETKLSTIKPMVDDVKKLDTVQVNMSGVLKEKSKLTNVDGVDGEDDLVIYDYSKSEASKVSPIAVTTQPTNKKDEAKAVNIIDEVEPSAKAVTFTKIASATKQSNLKPVEINEQVVDLVKVVDAGVSTQVDSQKKPAQSESLFENKEEEELVEGGAHKTSVIISVNGYSFNGGVEEIKDFRAINLDDQDNHPHASKDGYIHISKVINNQLGVKSVRIEGPSTFLDTYVDLAFGESEGIYLVPLILTNGLKNYLDSSRINGPGGHILIALGEDMEDVEIDSTTKYKAKHYLDKDMRPVDREEDNYSYVLFSSVRPGNAIMYYKTINNKIVTKIIHSYDEAVYYDIAGAYTEVKSDINFYSESPLTKDLSSLNVSTKDIEFISTKINLQKRGLNNYVLNNGIFPNGARKYLLMNHLDEKIFVGYWGNKNIVVPTNEYIKTVMEPFRNMKNLNSCLVQINLSKQVKYFTVSFFGKQRSQGFETMFLDKDGQFYEEIGENTNRIFIMANEQGVFNAEVEYVDGTFDYLQTFCSESIYLVEQL